MHPSRESRPSRIGKLEIDGAGVAASEPPSGTRGHDHDPATSVYSSVSAHPSGGSALKRGTAVGGPPRAACQGSTSGGLAEAQGRRGRGAQKKCAPGPGRGAGRSKMSGAHYLSLRYGIYKNFERYCRQKTDWKMRSDAFYQLPFQLDFATRLFERLKLEYQSKKFHHYYN
jgi:hypothetical protein